MPRLVADIDRLYQVPLSEFTSERNALAKQAGPNAAEIRALQKPTVPAWAINQLYWHNRDVYDQLIERADDLRATHQAALRGRRTDLRGAARAHEDAIEAALKATLALLARNDHPVTEATRQVIATTLRALPGEEPPGRLSRQLEPRGFETLAGAASQGRVRPAAPPKAPPKPEARAARKDRTAQIAAAREAAAAAGRVTRDAEHVARREEFEAARAARDAEKARQRLTDAEDALKQAKTELEAAKRAASEAVKASETARGRARKAADALAEARAREQRAKADTG